MSRHVIIGRLGAGDRSAVPTGTDEVATQLQFVQGTKRLDFGIGRALEDLARLNVFPSETGVDLMILAAHIHAADTRVSRNSESQDGWTREIRLVVPVKDVALWHNAATILHRMLNFLTGDRWIVDFRNRPDGFETIVDLSSQGLLDPQYENLSLFSGGLDSLIGAINELERGGIPLLISHAGEASVSNSQNALFSHLQNHYNGRGFQRLRIWMEFPTTLVKDVSPDKTTRGRSFLFFAAGVFASTGFQSGAKLRVPENGLIALNVPLDELRLGALSTRTTHPFYIARWNELIRKLGMSATIENPYWNKTKGEMVAECANPILLGALIPEAMSCSSPTKGRWTGHGSEHCGFCLPCLIRRAAINAGLGRKDPTCYTLANLKEKPLDTMKAEGRQVRSFQFAIMRLKKEPQLASFLIHKPGSLAGESPARLVDLAGVYSRGMEEVDKLLSGIETIPGWA